MRSINTSAVSSSAGMPVKKGTIEHLQLAYKEVFNEILKSTIGSSYSTTTPYRLYGAQLVDQGGDYFSTTKGSIFYNGELYLVDEVGASGIYMGDTIGLTISQTQFTSAIADPVTFTDTSVHNVHDIKKMNYFNSLVSGADSLPLPDNYNYSAPYGLGSVGGVYEPNSRIKLSYFQDPNSLNGATLKFTEDTLWKFTSSGISTNTVYLDSTGAQPGCHIKLYSYGSPGVAVNFIGTASATIIRTGATAIGAGTHFIADIIYGVDNKFYIQCTN